MTILAKLKTIIVSIALFVLFVVVLVFYGKNAARREIEVERLKATAKAIEERSKTNASVSEDNNLLDRARRIGVVRKP